MLLAGVNFAGRQTIEEATGTSYNGRNGFKQTV
jgi:hypothetical protein